MDTAAALPDDVDPELWFECVHRPGGRDYLVSTAWHTFPGRMSAWCSVRNVGFRVSKSELPPALPAATRYWVEGFLTGNLPRQPFADDDDSPQLNEWKRLAERFLATGVWPNSMGTDQQRRWWEDAHLLTQIGEALDEVTLPDVEVAVPASLADEARAAWIRNDDGPPAYESDSQRAARRSAGDLALIGSAVESTGVSHGDDVVVVLSAALVVAAQQAHRAGHGT